MEHITSHTTHAKQDLIVKLPFFQTVFTLGDYPALTLLVSWEDIRVILTGPICKLTPESEVIVTKFRGEQCPHLYHASDATLRGNSTFPFESFCIWFNLRRKQSAETKHPLCSLLFALCSLLFAHEINAWTANYYNMCVINESNVGNFMTDR